MVRQVSLPSDSPPAVLHPRFFTRVGVQPRLTSERHLLSSLPTLPTSVRLRRITENRNRARSSFLSLVIRSLSYPGCSSSNQFGCVSAWARLEHYLLRCGSTYPWPADPATHIIEYRQDGAYSCDLHDSLAKYRLPMPSTNPGEVRPVQKESHPGADRYQPATILCARCPIGM